jgi:NAD(P)-dependent dehydrogenase (short-subunit alcohol dehydrogenase family)
MAGRLEEKVALITGAARGIGEAHARIFAAEGASVVVADVLVDQGKALASRLRDEGRNAIFQKLDITSEDNWAIAVSAAVENFGKLTTLINNAAIFNAYGLEATSFTDWNTVITVNLTGSFLGMKAAMPELLKTGNAAIINICSLYGLIGTTGYTAYHSSKGGLRMLSKAVALEYAGRGVRVNTVFPGDTKTPAWFNLTEEENAKVRSLVPMGIEAEPRDIAYGSLYLASDEARYLTGSELVIDGGWSIP